MERMIDVSANVHGVFERARNVLIDDPGSVLGERRPTIEQRPRMFHADLAVELSGGMSVHQEVLIEAGLPKSSDGVLRLPLHWKATGREGLFPTFAGEVVAKETPSGWTPPSRHPRRAPALGHRSPGRCSATAGDGAGGPRFPRSVSKVVMREPL